jgi:hypothetical protein
MKLNSARYPKGVKIGDRQMGELEKTRLTRDAWHGGWNYNLRPLTHPMIMTRQPRP